MKYLNPSFSVSGYSKQGEAEYERIFGKRRKGGKVERGGMDDAADTGAGRADDWADDGNWDVCCR